MLLIFLQPFKGDIIDSHSSLISLQKNYFYLVATLYYSLTHKYLHTVAYIHIFTSIYMHAHYIKYIHKQVCRNEFDEESMRAFCVLAPVRVVITDWKGPNLSVKAPNHPRRKELGEREIPFTPVFFIERSDFRAQDTPVCVPSAEMHTLHDSNS